MDRELSDKAMKAIRAKVRKMCIPAWEVSGLDVDGQVVTYVIIMN